MGLKPTNMKRVSRLHTRELKAIRAGLEGSRAERIPFGVHVILRATVCFCRAHVIIVISSRTSSFLFRCYSALIYCPTAEALSFCDVHAASGNSSGRLGVVFVAVVLRRVGVCLFLLWSGSEKRGLRTGVAIWCSASAVCCLCVCTDASVYMLADEPSEVCVKSRESAGRRTVMHVLSALVYSRLILLRCEITRSKEE